MKINSLDEAYLNMSGNLHSSDYLNLAIINNDLVDFGANVLFLSEKEKKKINATPIKKFEDSIFVYKYGDSYGIIADLDIEEYRNKSVKSHELVLSSVIQGMMANYRLYNTEVAPVLLLHKERVDLKRFIHENEAVYQYIVGGYELFVYQGLLAQTLLEKYQKIESMYIADGHHRLYSTSLDKHKKGVLSCITSFDDVNIYPIHRVLEIDAHKFEGAKEFFKKVGMYIEETALEKGVVRITYRDEVIYIKLTELVDDTIWNNDILRLNTQVLNTGFRIQDYNDLEFVVGKDIDDIKKKLKKDEMLVELYPVSKEEFINFSDNEFIMPPKSTCFEPKFPSFLVMKKYK